MSRERRRYVAVMRPAPTEPTKAVAIERVARFKAVEDVARAIDKHLRTRMSDGRSTAGTPAEWAAWALRWPRAQWKPAPDGSLWGVTTRIDYV